jgi:phage/plasmid-associated DNA primase
VISRRERRHIKGKLQQLITEPFVSINQKSMPERIEANFANFVFLSNEDVPIDTNKDDRRFMVIKTQKTDDMDVDYFTELKSSIVESDLLGYLLNYDCGDFNEHTKPLLTDAKKDIIDANLTTEQNFIKQWLDGEAGFPIQTVAATSLYWAYQCWCAENGERFPSSSTTFGRAIASEKKIIKSYCSIKFTTKKVTAYFVGADTVSTTLEQEFLNQFDILVDDKKRKYHL